MPEVACISKECSGMYVRPVGQQSHLKAYKLKDIRHEPAEKYQMDLRHLVV
uniref:Uncharacterized protein n=1 Tax=Arundo donax TaxID=35708 RepID=A0A0A9FJ99_ARUDO